MKIKHLILLILATLALDGCRTDGGEIGYLYGQWMMRSYTIDGQAPTLDLSLYNWRFQGSIVCITKELPLHDFIENMGTWSQEGDTLSLNFTHGEVMDSTGTMKPYNPPAELGIPLRKVTPMHIDKLTDKELNLSFTDLTGRKKEYKLEKLK